MDFQYSTISPDSLDRAVLVWMQELSPHGIFVTDTELRIKGWNLWLETQSGIDKEKAIGADLLELFPELVARRLDGYFRRALKGEIGVLSAAFHGFLLPFPPPIREGGFANMLQTSRIAPLMQDGEIVGTITTIEDVTQREYHNSLVRRQHERQEIFSWALAHLLETADPENVAKEILPRIAAQVGVDAYALYLIDDDDKHFRLHGAGGMASEDRVDVAVLTWEDVLKGRAMGERQPIVFRNDQPDAPSKSTFASRLGLRSYVCHPLVAGEKTIGVLSFGSRDRDHFLADDVEFTRIIAQYVAVALERSRKNAALRKAQEQLSLHAQLLDKQVQERTKKLEETISELESFSYSLAHDVRAPLRHVQGFAHLLLEDYADKLPSDARGHINSIQRAIQRLDTLTHDILKYSRLSSHSVQLAPINVEMLVRDIVSHHAGLNCPGVVTLHTPLHPVIAERSLLEQCLSNLLDNALKFVPAGVDPRISVRTEIRQYEPPNEQSIGTEISPGNLRAAGHLSERKHDGRPWVRISIEDNGIGVSPEFHRKIFGIFERLSSQQYEGTGIGLAIVSKAIQRMGGRLGVESESGRGSTFWLQLPAA